MTQLGAVAAFLLPVLVPIVGLIGLGRLVVGIGLVDASGARGLTNLVFWFLMPALLFLSVAGGPPPGAAPAGPLPGAAATTGLYFAVALPLFGMAVAIGRAALRLTLAQASVFGLNAVFGNTVMMGIPVVGAVWGARGLPVLLSIVAAHSHVLLPLATILIELGPGRRGGGLWSAVAGPLVQSLKNPIISSILLAFLWRWVGLPLPDALRRLLELMGQAGPTLALICLGASLPDLRRASAGPTVLLAVAIKLLVMPAAMAVAAAAAAIPMPAAAVMVATAAMPTGANAFLLARRAESMMEESAATMVVATLCAAVTLSAVLAMTR